MALVPALAGHAGTKGPVMLVANVVHAVCVATWIGGIAVLVAVVPRAAARLSPSVRSRLMAAVASRFSTLASVAVAVILATGIVQSVAALDGVGGLTTTAYGSTVVLKLLLFAVLVGYGAAHRRSSLPALRRAAAGGEEAGGGMLDLLRTELVVAALVLVLTGALATLSPDRPAGAPPARASTR